MVTIITGKINSNKTSTMIAHHRKLGCGDGFVSVKNMVGDTVHSYDAMQLSTEKKQVLIKRDIFYDNDFTVACSIGPYLFSEETLFYIHKQVEAMVHANEPYVFLDEVGVLELESKGFDLSIKTVLKSNSQLVMAVREDLVEQLIRHYKIVNYTILVAK